MKKILAPAILALLVGLVYANTWENSFHYDDITSILQKPWVRGLDKIPQFIFSWAQRPFLILTYNLNFAISGYEVWSWHLFNILGHMTVVFLLYRLAALTLVFAPPETARRFAALPLLAAAVFAVHPINTQSVTYIASRSEILAAIFYLAALNALFEGFRRRAEQASAIFWLALVPPCLVLGALSKETIITLPAMAFLFHFYFVSGAAFRDWLNRCWRWMALTALLLAGAVGLKYLRDGRILSATYDPMSNAEYLLTETCVIPFEYFRKMLFPFNLSLDVQFAPVTDWTSPWNWRGIAALAVYTTAAIAASRRNAWAGFGLAWALITVLPTSSFIPLLDVAVEHRTYLPLAGFSMVFAAGWCLLAGWETAARRVATALAIALAFSAATLQRNTVWKDEISLWSDVKKKSPRLIRAYNNLGEAYDRLERYDEAIAEFEAALKMDPNYQYALNNLGNVYGKRQEFFKAIEYFERVLALNPSHASAHYNLARSFIEVGRKPEAVDHYRLAIEHNPYFEQAYYNLGELAGELGMTPLALESFKKFLEMRPQHPRALFAIGNVYARARMSDQAIDYYRQSLAADPKYLFPRINIGMMYLQMGRLDEALAAYEEVAALNPNIAGVHKNLGMLYLQHKSDPARALTHFRESLRLEPGQQQAETLRGIVADIERQTPTK